MNKRKLKNIIKKVFFSLFNIANKVVPKSKSNILLYVQNGGIQHALVPIRKYLIENNYLEKYNVYRAVENSDYFEDDDCNYVGQLKSFFIFLRSKYVFYTVAQIPIVPVKSQKVLHLAHGNANYKTYGLLANKNTNSTFYFSHRVLSSELFVEYDMKAYLCKRENEEILGDVMIDMFKYPLINQINCADNKLVLWLPTFRQADLEGYVDSDDDNLIPLFAPEDYSDLNEYLRKKGIIVVVKLHGLQKINNTNYEKLSNLILLTDKEFKNKGLELYPLLNSSDALIGDYSSVSMQYLMLNKPQAYVIPDIDSYKEKRGFLFENPEEYMAGWIIKDKSGFYQFVDDISEGKDGFEKDRLKLKKKIYKYDDFNNTKRVIDFSGISL